MSDDETLDVEQGPAPWNVIDSASMALQWMRGIAARDKSSTG